MTQFGYYAMQFSIAACFKLVQHGIFYTHDNLGPPYPNTKLGTRHTIKLKLRMAQPLRMSHLIAKLRRLDEDMMVE